MKITGVNLNSLAILGALGAVALVALYVAKKGVAGAAAGAVGAVGDVASGVVVGIGQTIGIPATNETECEKAKREGRTWDASFACPAGDWLRYVVQPGKSRIEDADETARLAARYQRPPVINSGEATPWSDPLSGWAAP